METCYNNNNNNYKYYNNNNYYYYDTKNNNYNIKYDLLPEDREKDNKDDKLVDGPQYVS